MNNCEARRIMWTTYKNLKLWFESWESTLEELGIALRGVDGKVYIPDHQMKNILNFDKTCLSLDGSDGARGGRPTVTFYDPRFPQLGRATSKGSLTTTMITGSTAAGEVLPPHFEFQTAAQSDNGAQIKYEAAKFMLHTRGQYGTDKEQNWATSIGANAKGGMDDVELFKYIKNTIMPLYPKAAPVKGKWVIVKVDSGPGRGNEDLLTELRWHGFILFPGVPNTAAVTQEMDQNYGPFKTAFRDNLHRVVDERFRLGLSTSMPPWLCGLFVFGGTDPLSKCVLTESLCKRHLISMHAWEDVGAAPLSMACLQSKKVRRKIGDGGDSDYEQLMICIQDANNVSTHALSQFTDDSGLEFIGDAMKAKIVTGRPAKNVSVPHSDENLELLETQGAVYHKLGGQHNTCDDFFLKKAEEKRSAWIKELNSKKSRAFDDSSKEEKGLLLINTKGPNANFTVAELNDLLRWYKVPNLTTKAFSSKETKLKKWAELQDAKEQPPACEVWTEEDELELAQLTSQTITMADTSLARFTTIKQKEFEIASVTFTDEQWEFLTTNRLQLRAAGDFGAAA
ncbi:LOW QUALITY PROTEIN: hypothetical protein ACHAWU_000340 [Discostella pseudostelligera]|uniref:Uncharacterized protein n=1 Tax=Discostella pseudostelligera TaxID=259834 RepID=A0ABD3MIJ4_9STRA